MEMKTSLRVMPGKLQFATLIHVFQSLFVRSLPCVNHNSVLICSLFTRRHSNFSLYLFAVYQVSLKFQDLFVYISPGVTHMSV